MSILTYYQEQQKYPTWVLKFQSTSNKQSGKTFSYVNTNYRHLVSFLTQLELFKNNNGKERSEWKTMRISGQEKDKHRIINLINAGLLKFETECYLFTNKGYTAQDIIDADFTNEERWLLTFLLCLDYHTEERDMDIVRTFKELKEYLMDANIDFCKIINEIPKACKITSTEDLFKTDIFWMVTFAKDKRFLEKFQNSEESERDKLKEYVITQHKNKKTTDCIGHKFTAGGAYTTGMFRDDLKMIYYINFVQENKAIPFEEFVDAIINSYGNIYMSCNKTKLKKFIIGHKSVFNKIYETIKESSL